MQLKKGYKEIVKSHGKFWGAFVFVLVYIHKLLEKCYIDIVKVCLPIDKSIVVFKSNPDYSDNARALAEYMIDKGYTKKYKIYFDVKNAKEYKCKNGAITFISSRAKYGRYKLSSIRLLFTAGYLMSTHEMIIIRRVARKGQLLVRLWHGCGYKDRSNQDGGERFFDVALVPGELFVKTKAHFWNVDKKFILPIGYPRYDWLRKKDYSAKKMIDSYKENQDSKIILWMPTFRIDKRGRCTETDNITQFPLIHNNEDWKEIDRHCKELNIVLIIKLHPFQTEYEIPFDSFSNIKKIDNQIFDDADIPMYKFVALTDALISDYSSIAVDYLIVDHPMAFTLDDFEEYRRARGFVFEDPRVYMPGHHLYTFDDLRLFLFDVSRGNDSYLNQRKKMRDKAICQSGDYCKSILNRFSIEL